MLEQSDAVFVGLVASAVLTPIVMAGWKRFDPPAPEKPVPLNEETIRLFKAIDREAVVAIVVFFILVGYAWGWGSALSAPLAIAMISSLLAIPYLWVTARCMLLGPTRPVEYSSYFQSKNRVGIKLASLVGIVSTYILVISLVASEFWSG